MSLSSPIITTNNLYKRYGKFLAVNNINLEVNRGEIFGLIGPDAAGKTTTFHILGGVMEATSADVKVLNRTPRDARLAGYLTQQFSLYLDLRYVGWVALSLNPTKTVLDVGFPCVNPTYNISFSIFANTHTSSFKCLYHLL